MVVSSWGERWTGVSFCGGCNCAVGKLLNGKIRKKTTHVEANLQPVLRVCVSLSTAPLTSSRHVGNPAAFIILIVALSVALKTARVQFKLL